MHNQENTRVRNCMHYAINESLFGQSRVQLGHLLEEMQIGLNIRFERCFLIVSGLPRRFYMERLGMRRADLIAQMQGLVELLNPLSREQGFAWEISVLNYDYSKRFVLVVSPEREDFDISRLAQRVGASVESYYAALCPAKTATTRNITVYSGLIDSYEAYQRAFDALRRAYDLSFFLRERDVLTLQQAQAAQSPTSMVEAERALSEISDLLFLRDVQGAEQRLHALFLGRLKRAQDRQLCAEVLVFLKKRLDDLCLMLGIPWAEENAAALDMDRYLCMEELYDSVCALLRRLLADSQLPALRPDSLSIRAARYIRKGYYRPLDLTSIADHLHVNPTYLSHIFKRDMGVGLTQYITRIRMEQAQRLLRETDQKVAQIAQDVGLSDPRYFNTVFKRQTGATPTEYREAHSVLREAASLQAAQNRV